MSNLKVKAAELRKALQLFVQRAELSDSEAMEFSNLYPTWEELLLKKQQVSAKTRFSYGTNFHGEPQLYYFLVDYVPVETYTPDQDTTHYKPIGIGDGGTPLWTQPHMREDSYMVGDEAWYNNEVWVNEMDYNVWAPGVIGWRKKAEAPTEPDADPDVEYNSNGTVKGALWVNPVTGEVGLFGAGDVVSDESGALWESLYAKNGNPPSAGWWKEVSA